MKVASRFNSSLTDDPSPAVTLVRLVVLVLPPTSMLKVMLAKTLLPVIVIAAVESVVPSPVTNTGGVPALIAEGAWSAAAVSVRRL